LGDLYLKITTPFKGLPGGRDPIGISMKLGVLGAISLNFHRFCGISLKYFKGIPPSKRVLISKETKVLYDLLRPR